MFHGDMHELTNKSAGQTYKADELEDCNSEHSVFYCVRMSITIFDFCSGNITGSIVLVLKWKQRPL